MSSILLFQNAYYHPYISEEAEARVEAPLLGLHDEDTGSGAGHGHAGRRGLLAPAHHTRGRRRCLDTSEVTKYGLTASYLIFLISAGC